ncbi:MAG TPA: OstA-like protein [Bacteroidales bacterium]|nr:OstA-like protein [Bacteroidales bacterium]HNS46737.1 OstA-like protein [Bacteroidales bacterium]
MILRNAGWMLILLVLRQPCFSQDTALIRLIQSDEISYDRRANANVQVLTGNIILEHDNIYLYCDTAYLNEVENRVEAMGDVHVESRDTLHLYGKHIWYDGNTKIGEIEREVRLIDDQTTLYSEYLIYNRLTQESYYHDGGRVLSGEKELQSESGYYYVRVKEFAFSRNVTLKDTDYTVRADTMRYNTETEIAYFIGPTHIESEDFYIYCQTGWFDTRNDKSYLGKNSRIHTGDQILAADSIYYEQKTGLGRAFRNITVTDTVQDIVLKGNYSLYSKEQKFSMITDSALAILADREDTLFMHADTLIARFDSAQKARDLLAYHRVKFYRTDIQGMCDSLHNNIADSVLTLYNDPVLWSDENQLTADSIRIWFRNRQIDRMNLHNTSLIISMDDTLRFNQIRGLNMIGYFTENQLQRIRVESNSETIYYVRDEDESLIGVNKAVSGSMWIFVNENKIERIVYIDRPVAVLYPEKDLPEEEKKLRGFNWRENQRPRNKNEIFLWRE